MSIPLENPTCDFTEISSVGLDRDRSYRYALPRASESPPITWNLGLVAPVFVAKLAFQIAPSRRMMP